MCNILYSIFAAQIFRAQIKIKVCSHFGLVMDIGKGYSYNMEEIEQ